MNYYELHRILKGFPRILLDLDLDLDLDLILILI